MRHTLLCYIRLVGAYVRGIMINRWSFLLVTMAVMLVNFTNFIGIWLIMTKFGSIKGWTYGQVVFIYILSLLSYGIRNLFFFQFREVGNLVQRGDMDSILIRPVNPFVYTMGTRFETGGFAYILLGIGLIFVMHDKFGIIWSTENIVYFILAVLSAALVQGAITVSIGAAAFFLTETGGLDRVYGGLREFIWYPISLYNMAVKFILFFVIPLAFASYVPAGVFLNNPDYLILPKWVWKLSLLSGLILFAASYAFWKKGIKHYQSTGT